MNKLLSFSFIFLSAIPLGNACIDLSGTYEAAPECNLLNLKNSFGKTPALREYMSLPVSFAYQDGSRIYGEGIQIDKLEIRQDGCESISFYASFDGDDQRLVQTISSIDYGKGDARREGWRTYQLDSQGLRVEHKKNSRVEYGIYADAIREHNYAWTLTPNDRGLLAIKKLRLPMPYLPLSASCQFDRIE